MIPGRNEPCHCGSGKKYKKCCETKDQTKSHKENEKQQNAAEKAFAAQKEKDEKEGKVEPGHPSYVPPKNAPSHSAVRHTSGHTPKFNMPRKSGGGGA